MNIKLLGIAATLALALAACAPTNTDGMAASDTSAMSSSATATDTTLPANAGSPTDIGSTATDATPATTAATPAATTTTTATAQAAPAMAGGDPSGMYQVTKQPTAPADITPTGTVTVAQGQDGNTRTDISLTGLKPGTFYVAHYHNQGDKSTDPCASGGEAILSSKIVGQPDSQGALTLSGSVATADIANATYFNIHTASDPQGTPADAGVACTPLTRK